MKKLGLSRAEAVIRVIEQPSSGLFGFVQQKDAVVEVGAAGSETEDVTETARDMTSAAAETADGEEETVSAAEEPGKTSWAAIRKKFLRRRRKNAAVRETPFSAEEQEEAAEEAKRFLTGVFKGMKMEVQLEKMVNEERILFNLHGEGLGILIGKHTARRWTRSST